MAVLVACASRHGATTGIAEEIANTLRSLGHEATVAAVEDVDDVSGYEAVVLGSAVYYGHWLTPATEFVLRHEAALREKPVWLFSSGPLGVQPSEEPTLIAELRQTIQPRDHHVFPGALDRRRLGVTERLAASAVRAPEGDFRDWHGVDAWAEAIARRLDRPVAVSMEVERR